MFSPKALEQLEAEFAQLDGKYQSLLMAFVTHVFTNSKAKEHAVHGFARRAKNLARAIRNVFAILPPDRDDLPTPDELTDAA